MKTASTAGVVIALIVTHLALVIHGAVRHSAVFDEVVYPTSGYTYLTTGDYRMNPEHPPFLKLWVAVPWLGSGIVARETPGWAEGDQWRLGRAMLFDGGLDARALLLAARLMIAALSAAAAVGVFVSARWIAAGLVPGSDGRTAALAALTLYVFDPLVVAHAGLATTDLGGAALYFLAAVAMARALVGGERRFVLLAGAVTGLALASKFTALLLVLFVPAAAWVAHRTGAPRVGRSVAWIVVVAAGVVVATYGPAGPAKYLEGLEMLRHHGDVGHPTYAFGQYGRQGWWWYFPAAWAIKTPIPVLLASIAGVVAAVAARRRFPVAVTVLLVAPGLVASVAVFSSLNLGVRHLLPVTPFLAVMGGLAAGRAWEAGGSWGRGVVVIAAASLVAGTVHVHPDEMAYANEAAGSSERLWTRLSDSNVDWGQDLPALAEEIRRYPLDRLYLAYFGTSDPAAYGLPQYHWIPSFDMIPKRRVDAGDPGGRTWIAVSATNLVGLYSADHDAYEWLRDRPFSAFPGHSIALWDITGDATAHHLIGRTALSYGEPDAALEPLRSAVELDADLGQAWVDLARASAALGRFDEALASCGEAQRRLPGSVEARDLCDMVRADAGT